MDFGRALNVLKAGGKVTRTGWNGKGMFLWMKPGTVIEEAWIHDAVLLDIARANDGKVEGLPTVCMKTADNRVVTGWVPSQADMFAEDWESIFESDVPTDELNDIVEDDRFENALDSGEWKKMPGISDSIAKAKREMEIMYSEGKTYKDAIAQRHESGDILAIDALRSELQRKVTEIILEGDKNNEEKAAQVEALKKEYLSEPITTEETEVVEEMLGTTLNLLRGV